MNDSERLDWLESLMRPGHRSGEIAWVEIFMAGLRNGRAPGDDPWAARSYQVELVDQPAVSGPTLREAIDNARAAYDAAADNK